MKKDLNFEVNIIPILDILSVLICFLLLTAVWIQLGSIDTQQAVGDNNISAAQTNPPSLWIAVGSNGALRLSLRDVKTSMPLERTVNAGREGINWDIANSLITNIKTQLPDLKTVIIRPAAKVNYGDVIRLMDNLKKLQLTDIGLSPLG